MINELLYQVGDFKTYSKVEAARVAQGDFNKVHFNFMDSTFMGHPWYRPSETWEELMRQRCVRLREKYSYLCVWFSGGWDSATVLETFIKHNIKLDEIAIYDRKYFDGDTEVASAIEYAKTVKDRHMPNVKLSLIPINIEHSQQVYDKYGDQWIFTPGCSLMYPKTHRYFIEHELDDTRSIRAENETRGNIWAHDKSKVLLYDNKWYAFAVDTSMTPYFNTDCELFFCSSDLPELYILQTHMAIDFFERIMANSGKVDTELSHNIQGNKVTDEDYRLWNLAQGRTHCVNNPSALYGWLKSTVGHHPMGGEGRKAYLFNRDINSKFYKIYTDGIKAVEEITGLKTPTTDKAWLPSLISHKHYVRDLNNNLLTANTNKYIL